MRFKTRLLFACFLLLFNLPPTSVWSHHLWWKQIRLNTGITTQNKPTAAVRTLSTLMKVMRVFLPLITRKHVSTYLPKYFHLTLSVLKIKVKNVEPVVQVGEWGRGGIKRHMGGSGWFSGGASLGAATQGWRFMGCNPQSSQPCVATDPCSVRHKPPQLPFWAMILPPRAWHHMTSQSETTLSCHLHAKPCSRLLPEDTSEIDCTCDLFISTTISPLISLSHPFATPDKHTKLIIMSNSSGRIFWDSFVGFFFLSDSLSSDRKGKKLKITTNGASKIN